MSLIGTVRVLLAGVGALLVLAPGAEAAVDNAFDGGLPCSVQGDDTRLCAGIVESFDGAPIDVNFVLPPAPAEGADGDYPLVMEFHGWGGSKLDNYESWTEDGYAYFSVSDRGWGDSCGGLDPKRLEPVCENGFNHLMDTRYEVRDVQELVGKLVDDGLVDPTRIATMGSSYGGGISMSLAALRNRKMLRDGQLVPWTSPDGTPVEITAAAPDIPWSDLANSLLPNGRTLDYVADAPYDMGPIGIMKQSFVTGLFGLGAATSNYAPPGTYADADLYTWYGLITAGEPYDSNPLAQDIVDEVTTHHSSYYIDDSVQPPPMLISNGFADDIFPVDEALRFYNRTKATHPDADISLFFSDHGHQRAQNKPADTALRRERVHAWFDHYLLGQGAEPAQGVETLTQRCGGPSEGPYTAPTWRAIAPGEVRLDATAAKLISPAAGDPSVGQAYDPITGSGACATASGADQPGLASYRLPPAPNGGYTLMGSPTIVADILSPGPHSQLAVRLVDVDPATGQGTLVSRGLYRPDSGLEATRQVFQLHPNGYHFAAGHIPKLELMPDDFPYSRKTNGQLPITVSKLQMRLPVLEAPGTQGAVSPAPKFVPQGYELAPDYVDAPLDSDGDGIADPDDDCPAEPGPASNNGCPVADPDTDGDGIPDSTDACPNDDGPVENNGCPVTDADGDGIDDADDECPNEPGPASTGGCPTPPPDGDGDGVPDAQDVCPDEPGPASNFGCPEDEEPPPPPPPPARPCEKRIAGTSKPDTLLGTEDGERILGRAGADRIKGRRGIDCLSGQEGGDRINGGRGTDALNGGRGKDRIQAVDGERDTIRCGPGKDLAIVDRRDRVRGCEKVSEREL